MSNQNLIFNSTTVTLRNPIDFANGIFDSLGNLHFETVKIKRKRFKIIADILNENNQDGVLEPVSLIRNTKKSQPMKK